MFITQLTLHELRYFGCARRSAEQKALYHSSPDFDQEVRVLRITIAYIHKQVCKLLLEELSDICCPP